MSTIETLMERNARFAERGVHAGLGMAPRLRTIVIGCADPRVDPAEVLGLEAGDAVVIRNVGGRITPDTLKTMATLRMVALAEGGAPGEGWNLIVLQHTDCGITRLTEQTELLATLFGVAPGELTAKAIADPRQAVAVDVAALRANPFLPDEFVVSGLVYDVDSGLIDVVLPPVRLRATGVAA